MDKRTSKLLKIMLYAKKMSDIELEALVAELMRCYFWRDIQGIGSTLIDFLEDDKFLEFQALAKFMNEQGKLIKGDN